MNRMSDRLLADIGLDRAEIPRLVVRLIGPIGPSPTTTRHRLPPEARLQIVADPNKVSWPPTEPNNLARPPTTQSGIRTEDLQT